MKFLKQEIKILNLEIRNNKLEQENEDLKEQINTMIKNAKERESNLKYVIKLKDMYKKGLKKEKQERIKTENDYNLLSEDYAKQTKKLNNIQKKINKK